MAFQDNIRTQLSKYTSFKRVFYLLEINII